MSNISQSQANLVTAADGGMDVVSGAISSLAATSISGLRGWKYCVCLAETIISAIVDDGSPASTNLTTWTYAAGTLLSANGLFTSITLTSGTVAMVRG